MFANRRLPNDRQLAVIIGLCLMAATYLVFSVRAVLDPASPGDFLSLKRLIATAAGAGVFLLAVTRAAAIPARRWSERMVGLLWVTVLGGLAILVVRIGYDLFVDDRAGAIVARNARWVLAWLGYFGAAIGGYFAITFLRRSVRREQARRAFDRAEVAAVLIDEVAEWTPQERRALLVRLSRIKDYEETDLLVGCLDEPHD